MGQQHGAPMSEHERKVLKELEFEIVCQMVVVDKEGDPEVVCFADGQWLVRCRFCPEEIICCGTHASMIMRFPDGATCKRCGTSRRVSEQLFQVRPLPAGAL